MNNKLPPSLCIHAFRKMRQAEHNTHRALHAGKNRAMRKWARQYLKWAMILITRNNKPTEHNETPHPTH